MQVPIFMDFGIHLMAELSKLQNRVPERSKNTAKITVFVILLDFRA